MSVSPMNPSANPDPASIKAPQKPEASPDTSERGQSSATTGGSEKPNEKPLDLHLNGPSYRALSTSRSAILLSSTIAGNCLCSAFICCCLWGFSKVESLEKWQKRTFNSLSLLLSAALAFGIGFLFDRIGLLARGTLLQHNRYSVKGVCTSLVVAGFGLALACGLTGVSKIGYIMRGTLTSYTLLFIHQVNTRRERFAPTTWILFLFLLSSLVGRFGVAFIGFAFNIEDRSHYTAPLFRPNWTNGTVNSNPGIHEMASAYPVSIPQGDRGK